MDKIVITDYGENILSLQYEEDELVQISASLAEQASILGNIYVGKVKNIVKNISAAFIEIENKTMCYYSLIENKKPIFLNIKKDDIVKPGDEILVQVMKEELNAKAPVVRSCINFTGRYIVVTHGKTDIGISNKIGDEEERKRLRSIIKPYKNNIYGFIVRTSAKGVEKELIIKELENLVNLYKDTVNKAINTPCFRKVYKAPSAYICDIRDSNLKGEVDIVTDNEDLFDEINLYLGQIKSDGEKKVRLYKDDYSLKTLYNIKNVIANVLKEKVWLKSGGNVVIQQTEALVAVDVNTSKAINGKGDVQKTFLKINLEAAKEIAKQIRLRNLGGIIIVDFIDLEKEEDREYLINEFDKILKKDPIKTTLIDMTKLNLVEITRKKVRKPLYLQIKP